MDTTTTTSVRCRHVGRRTLSRGDEPYYCPPDGWVNIALLDENYEEENRSAWPIMYHGTKKAAVIDILNTRLRAGPRAAHGPAVYVSPSIIYSSHDTYAEWWDAPNGLIQVQAVLMCQVNPREVEKKACNTLSRFKNCDPNHPDDTIEWTLLPDRPNNEVSEKKIRVCGVMLRQRAKPALRRKG